MTTTKDEIRGNLSKYLKLADMRQAELADALGVTQGAVSNWLNGNNSIDIEQVPRICECLGITVAALMGQEELRPLGCTARRLVRQLEALDVSGQAKLIDYADDLIASGRYVPTCEDDDAPRLPRPVTAP